MYAPHVDVQTSAMADRRIPSFGKPGPNNSNLSSTAVSKVEDPELYHWTPPLEGSQSRKVRILMASSCLGTDIAIVLTAVRGTHVNIGLEMTRQSFSKPGNKRSGLAMFVRQTARDKQRVLLQLCHLQDVSIQTTIMKDACVSIDRLRM